MKILRFYSNNKILSYLSDDFLDKIYPLKELLPKDLADELVKFNIARNRKPNIDEIKPPRSTKPIYDSILIRNRYFAFLLVGSIRKKIYIIIITNGGYNPLYWNSSGLWKSTFDSFKYFFADVKPGYRKCKSNGNQNSIGNNPNYAPLFDSGWYLYNTIITSLVFGIVKNLEVIDGMPIGKFNVN
ncbi:hypothetical protein GLOIN_2v1483637 [Rhizophagus irregularis DAOM 181602=DAOM 197198]|nr:hypothetical protein GLOIN_2v1483637 [Rhizophagus irregularis DAOM 181602=DAOM 197198]